MRQTVHESGGLWIGHVEKDDRNVRCRSLGGSHRLILEGHDQIDALLDELLGRLPGRCLIGQVPPVQVGFFPSS